MPETTASTEIDVHALQHDIAWEDATTTLAKIEARVAGAAAAGAQLIVLPEMFACGFSMRTDRTAEPLDGPSATFLRENARSHGTWVGGSIPVRDDPDHRPTNAFLVAGPAGQLHRYNKIHPFTHGGEHRHFDAGDRLVTVSIGGLRVSLFVCYDLRFADEFWQLAPRTDAYLVVANWPAARRDHWRTLLAARAVENQAYVVGVNRIGTGRTFQGDPLPYAGDSMVIDPSGSVVADAGSADGSVRATLSNQTVRAARRSMPVLADRRTGTGR